MPRGRVFEGELPGLSREDQRYAQRWVDQSRSRALGDLGRVRIEPGDRDVRRARTYATGADLLQELLSKPLRKRTPSDTELLRAVLEDRLRMNPNDDFARLMLEELGISKKTPDPKIRTKVPGRVRPETLAETVAKQKALRKSQLKVATKIVSRFIPGVGQLQTVADAATIAVSVVEAAQDAAMVKAVGKTTFPGYKPQPSRAPSSGPTTRGRAASRTSEATAGSGTRPAPAPKPSAVLRPATPVPETVVSQVPGSVVQPGGQRAPGPAAPSQPSGQRAPAPAPRGDRTPAPQPGPAWNVQGSIDPFASLRKSPATRVMIERATRTATGKRPKEKPYALTAAQGPGGQCECPPGKQRKPKRRKQPRSVCYAGTYTERARGLAKRRRRRVPCR